MKLLSISTDRKIFEFESAVRHRQAVYAKDTEETHIIIFSGKNESEQSISEKCFIYPTLSPSKFLYAFDAIRLGRQIIEGRQITNITCQDPFLTAMAGMSLKRRYKIPLEIQVHTDIGSPHFTYTRTNKIRKSLTLSYLPKADSIRVVSERIKKYLVEKLRIPAEKITVKPIKVDVDAIKNAGAYADLHKKYLQFKKIVLMVSRMEPEKQIDLALRAFAKVAAKDKSVGLVLVGSGGEQNKLKSLVYSLGIENNVVFEPWANDMRIIYSYYKTADVFLNTSLYEGYGMTLAEAHAAGQKIVSTDVGVARELGAEIVDWSAESIANGIIKALAL